jgi:hypothetical protein
MDSHPSDLQGRSGQAAFAEMTRIVAALTRHFPKSASIDHRPNFLTELVSNCLWVT